MNSVTVEVSEHDPKHGINSYDLDDAEYDLLIRSRDLINREITKRDSEAAAQQ